MDGGRVGYFTVLPFAGSQAFIQAGECSTLLQPERTGLCKFNRNETELPTNQLGEEGWLGLGSVPFHTAVELIVHGGGEYI